MLSLRKIITILFLALGSALFAQDLISVNDLNTNLKNDKYVVIYAGAADDYKAHIPGAVHIAHNSLYNDVPVKSMLKPAADMAKILGQNGVSNDQTIVVYDEGSGKYSNRMYWILKYLGAPNVKVLDGNLKAWKALRKPITGAPSTAKATTFTPKVVASELATMADVKAANSSVVIVDVRKADEYAGTATTELRKGHIPGAVNINYETMFDAKGLFKSADELKAIFNAQGVTADKTAILYCETSVRAGAVYFALKSILKYPKVKVYDGAYIEWQATASNKVE